MLNETINLRGFVQEFIMNSHELNERFKTGVKETPPFYILVGLVIKGNRLKNEQLLCGMSYCHDCSSERGKKVEHFTNPVFDNFRNESIVKKHAVQLDRIAEIIF